jgi:hypothetical protein
MSTAAILSDCGDVAPSVSADPPEFPLLGVEGSVPDRDDGRLGGRFPALSASSIASSIPATQNSRTLADVAWSTHRLWVEMSSKQNCRSAVPLASARVVQSRRSGIMGIRTDRFPLASSFDEVSRGWHSNAPLRRIK